MSYYHDMDQLDELEEIVVLQPDNTNRNTVNKYILSIILLICIIFILSIFESYIPHGLYIAILLILSIIIIVLSGILKILTNTVSP